MSKHEKRLERLKTKPRDFTWDEATAVLAACGFDLVRQNGSHRTYLNRHADLMFNIAEPHPGNELKTYQVNALLKILEEAGCIR